jgi:hypothetical protein
MAPQDDLTAERAAIALLEQMGLYGHPAASQFIGDIIAALKTARQEALRECRDYALACVHERAVQLDGFTGSSEMAGVIRGKQSEAQRITDKLDRLASEGG